MAMIGNRTCYARGLKNLLFPAKQNKTTNQKIFILWLHRPQTVRLFYSYPSSLSNKAPTTTTTTPPLTTKLTGDSSSSTHHITSSSPRAIKISREMKLYLERTRDHEIFMKEKEAEYEIGRRHLANIMGANPDTFSQEDINRAIAYLLPSGLFDKKARPLMAHPSKLFPVTKASQFDVEGRPYHYKFYTGRPNFYEIIGKIEEHLFSLDQYEDEMVAGGVLHPNPDDVLSLEGYDWMSREQLAAMTIERMTEWQYESFVTYVTRLVEHPYSYRARDFIMRFFNKLPEARSLIRVPEIQFDAEGRSYAQARGTKKSSVAYATVHTSGTGHYYINGKSLYESFLPIHLREELLFPLIFTDLVRCVDVNAVVTGGGESSQAGAVRYGVSLCLSALISDDRRERMRQAGLLSRDPRYRERKKPGQPGARKKPKWRKR